MTTTPTSAIDHSNSGPFNVVGSSRESRISRKQLQFLAISGDSLVVARSGDSKGPMPTVGMQFGGPFLMADARDEISIILR